MPVEIFLDNASAEPQYETIEKDELTEKDTIVETVIEEAIRQAMVRGLLFI